jgi:hypothetical protein
MASGCTYCVNPIVPTFREMIKNFGPNSDGSYQTAIDNIVRDMNGDGNPHGNITAAAQKSLDARCALSSGVSGINIALLVEEHQSHQKASGAMPRKKPDDDLRRVVSFDTFATYHREGNIEGLANFMIAGSVETDTLPVSLLSGSTGQSGSLSWWTFGPPCPGNGQQYEDELALSPRSDATADAREINGVVEVRIPSAAFPKELFKPSALDGFRQRSKFAPDLTDSEHGWTKPDMAKVGLERRPELVSQSFSYSDIARGTEINVTYLSF